MIAYVFTALTIAFGLVLIPEPVAIESSVDDAMDWTLYWQEAHDEYADEFTALFEAIEFKRSKNGRSMIRRPGDNSFRFVKSA